MACNAEADRTQSKPRRRVTGRQTSIKTTTTYDGANVSEAGKSRCSGKRGKATTHDESGRSVKPIALQNMTHKDKHPSQQNKTVDSMIYSYIKTFHTDLLQTLMDKHDVSMSEVESTSSTHVKLHGKTLRKTELALSEFSRLYDTYFDDLQKAVVKNPLSVKKHEITAIIKELKGDHHQVIFKRDGSNITICGTRSANDTVKSELKSKLRSLDRGQFSDVTDRQTAPNAGRHNLEIRFPVDINIFTYLQMIENKTLDKLLVDNKGTISINDSNNCVILQASTEFRVQNMEKKFADLYHSINSNLDQITLVVPRSVSIESATKVVDEIKRLYKNIFLQILEQRDKIVKIYAPKSISSTIKNEIGSRLAWHDTQACLQKNNGRSGTTVAHMTCPVQSRHRDATNISSENEPNLVALVDRRIFAYISDFNYSELGNLKQLYRVKFISKIIGPDAKVTIQAKTTAKATHAYNEFYDIYRKYLHMLCKDTIDIPVNLSSTSLATAIAKLKHKYPKVICNCTETKIDICAERTIFKKMKAELDHLLTPGISELRDKSQKRDSARFRSRTGHEVKTINRTITIESIVVKHMKRFGVNVLNNLETLSGMAIDSDNKDPETVVTFQAKNITREKQSEDYFLDLYRKYKDTLKISVVNLPASLSAESVSEIIRKVMAEYSETIIVHDGNTAQICAPRYIFSAMEVKLSHLCQVAETAILSEVHNKYQANQVRQKQYPDSRMVNHTNDERKYHLERNIDIETIIFSYMNTYMKEKIESLTKVHKVIITTETGKDTTTLTLGANSESSLRYAYNVISKMTQRCLNELKLCELHIPTIPKKTLEKLIEKRHNVLILEKDKDSFQIFGPKTICENVKREVEAFLAYIRKETEPHSLMKSPTRPVQHTGNTRDSSICEDRIAASPDKTKNVYTKSKMTDKATKKIIGLDFADTTSPGKSSSTENTLESEGLENTDSKEGSDMTSSTIHKRLSPDNSTVETTGENISDSDKHMGVTREDVIQAQVHNSIQSHKSSRKFSEKAVELTISQKNQEGMYPALTSKFKSNEGLVKNRMTKPNSGRLSSTGNSEPFIVSNSDSSATQKTLAPTFYDSMIITKSNNLKFETDTQSFASVTKTKTNRKDTELKRNSVAADDRTKSDIMSVEAAHVKNISKTDVDALMFSYMLKFYTPELQRIEQDYDMKLTNESTGRTTTTVAFEAETDNKAQRAKTAFLQAFQKVTLRLDEAFVDIPQNTPEEAITKVRNEITNKYVKVIFEKCSVHIKIVAPKQILPTVKGDLKHSLSCVIDPKSHLHNTSNLVGTSKAIIGFNETIQVETDIYSYMQTFQYHEIERLKDKYKVLVTSEIKGFETMISVASSQYYKMIDALIDFKDIYKQNLDNLKVSSVNVPSNVAGESVNEVIEHVKAIYDKVILNVKGKAVIIITSKERYTEIEQFLIKCLSQKVHRNRSLATQPSLNITAATFPQQTLKLTNDYGVSVIISKGDITKLQVDVIVNAANGNLCHAGGVAKAISDAAGPAFQRDCYEYVRRRGTVATGDVCVTGAGDLPCRYVIHAVGPAWDDYPNKSECSDVLEHTYSRCLKKASSLSDVNSIAVPTISGGTYGVPPSIVSSTMSEAVTKFCKRKCHLKYVHLITVDEHLVGLIEREFRGTKSWNVVNSSSERNTNAVNSQPVMSPAVYQGIGIQSSATSQNKSTPSHIRGSAELLGDRGPLALTNVSGVTIIVSEGDITKLGVDVIVNAANSYLYHKGGVAEAISNAAGPSLNKVCKEHIRKHGTLSVGEVFVTPGGNLCRYIIHAVGPRWSYSNETQCKRTLVNTYLQCLKTAHYELKDVRSIAIPTISGGNLGFPKAEVTSAMCDAVTTFCEHHCNLKSVHLITIDRDLVDSIKQNLIRRKTLQVVTQNGQTNYVGAEYQNDPNWRTSKVAGSSSILGSYDNHFSNGQFRSVQAANWEESDYSGATADMRQSIRPDNYSYMDTGSLISYTTASSRRNRKMDYSRDVTEPKSLPPNAWNSQHRSHDQETGYSTVNNTQLDNYQGLTSNFHLTPRNQNSIPGYYGPTSLQSQMKNFSMDNSNPDSPKTVKDNQSTVNTSDDKSNCIICMSDITDPKTLPDCKHTFCRVCIDTQFTYNPTCPLCGHLYGTITGTQPINGRMNDTKLPRSLPGYESYGTIQIDYFIPSGIQTSEHPNPGMSYSATTRVAYLPDNKEGRFVLELLKKAFERRLIFTIGKSTTTGSDNQVTWNDIHHKTNTHGGPTNFGYPDPFYLKRVKEELAAKGIK